MNNFQNQKIGILGLGEENLTLVEYLTKHGANNITICDRKGREELGEYYQQVKDLPVQFRLGPHYLDHLEDFQMVFRTPGLPYLNEKIQAAQKAEVEISSQTKLFFTLCPSPIIGITGTKGKGTTTALISEILKEHIRAEGSLLSEMPVESVLRLRRARREPKRKQMSRLVRVAGSVETTRGKRSDVYLGGNIGNPPIEFLDQLTQDDIVVLELSSFQLQDLEQSPHIAVVLDIKVDHLDYHQDETEYIEAKRNIVKHQTKDDFAIINADYLTSIEFASSTIGQVWWFSRRKSVDLGTFVKADELVLRTEDNEYPIIKTAHIQLRGLHNLENITAAVTAAHLCGAEIESIKKAVKEFKGLEHRLEFVREIGGVKFYNDSFSTTPDTTIAAINSFNEPIILLLGGSQKNSDYQELVRVIKNSNIKAIISIGLTSQRIIEAIGESNIEILKEIIDINEAVKIAKEKAESGDVVLLSPASASFDRFHNYKERGNIFKQEVNKL